jgi:release factor glutamine methyltransferase
MKTYHAKEIFLEVRGKLEPYYGQESGMLGYILLEEYLKIDRTSCVIDRVFSLREKQISKLDQAIERLRKFEPVQYITGKADFLGRKFTVIPNVLIPRPETEELILHIKKMNTKMGPTLFDIGCGSGCIAISLSLEIPDAKIYALDKTSESVSLTRKNAHKLGVDLQVYKHDIFKQNWPFAPVDIMVSNPPYVRESEKKDMKPTVLNYEPGEALFVADDKPLIYYDRIMEITEDGLIPGGLLFFEINEHFGNEIYKLLKLKGFDEVQILKDIHGKDRFAVGRKVT